MKNAHAGVRVTIVLANLHIRFELRTSYLRAWYAGATLPHAAVAEVATHRNGRSIVRLGDVREPTAVWLPPAGFHPSRDLRGDLLPHCARGARARRTAARNSHARDRSDQAYVRWTAGTVVTGEKEIGRITDIVSRPPERGLQQRRKHRDEGCRARTRAKSANRQLDRYYPVRPDRKKGRWVRGTDPVWH